MAAIGPAASMMPRIGRDLYSYGLGSYGLGSYGLGSYGGDRSGASMMPGLGRDLCGAGMRTAMHTDTCMDMRMDMHYEMRMDMHYYYIFMIIYITKCA